MNLKRSFVKLTISLKKLVKCVRLKSIRVINLSEAHLDQGLRDKKVVTLLTLVRNSRKCRRS